VAPILKGRDQRAKKIMSNMYKVLPVRTDVFLDLLNDDDDVTI
jgi:hypothetical protein